MKTTLLKIIFLDIDGVLNNVPFHKNFKGTFTKSTDEIDTQSVLWLNDLIKETDAKVVVTSTWRLGKTVEELQKILEDKGFVGEVIGKTDSLNNGYVFRGNEILKWMKDNEQLVGYYAYYESYVIFDDDSDMLYWQKDNFIKIDPWFGLSPNHCYKAKKILNKSYSTLESI